MATDTFDTKVRFYHSGEYGTFVCVEAMASVLEEIAEKQRSYPADAFRELASSLRRAAMKSERELHAK